MLTSQPNVFAFIAVRPPRRRGALERPERGRCNSLAKVFDLPVLSAADALMQIRRGTAT
jgi:hypothetical protein